MGAHPHHPTWHKLIWVHVILDLSIYVCFPRCQAKAWCGVCVCVCVWITTCGMGMGFCFVMNSMSPLFQFPILYRMHWNDNWSKSKQGVEDVIRWQQSLVIIFKQMKSKEAITWIPTSRLPCNVGRVRWHTCTHTKLGANRDHEASSKGPNPFSMGDVINTR